jgi:hypothetical protein
MFPYIIEPLHNCVRQKYQSLLSLCAKYDMKVVLLVYAIYFGSKIYSSCGAALQRSANSYGATPSFLQEQQQQKKQKEEGNGNKLPSPSSSSSGAALLRNADSYGAVLQCSKEGDGNVAVITFFFCNSSKRNKKKKATATRLSSPSFSSCGAALQHSEENSGNVAVIFFCSSNSSRKTRGIFFLLIVA